jgi:hypothetical protein
MGKGHVTIRLMNIVETTSIVVEENFDCLASIEHKYYVEVLNNPLCYGRMGPRV